MLLFFKKVSFSWERIPLPIVCVHAVCTKRWHGNARVPRTPGANAHFVFDMAITKRNNEKGLGYLEKKRRETVLCRCEEEMENALSFGVVSSSIAGATCIGRVPSRGRRWLLASDNDSVLHQSSLKFQ